MNSLSVACRRSLMLLVTAAFVGGTPVPASASEKQSAVSGEHHLTLDGQPLSVRILTPPVTRKRGSAASVAAFGRRLGLFASWLSASARGPPPHLTNPPIARRSRPLSRRGRFAGR